MDLKTGHSERLRVCIVELGGATTKKNFKKMWAVGRGDPCVCASSVRMCVKAVRNWGCGPPSRGESL